MSDGDVEHTNGALNLSEKDSSVTRSHISAVTAIVLLPVRKKIVVYVQYFPGRS